MKITKIGHCCLVIEDGGKVILTDPGAWTTGQNEVRGVHIILITHEHADHFHVESVETILTDNPRAVVVTNSRVAELLAARNISATIVEDSQEKTIEAMNIIGVGTEHAPIYTSVPPVMNTGYILQNRLFYPGDALTYPKRAIEILAMPIAAPWLTLAQAIDWALVVKPTTCFPVHDGMLQPREWIYGLPAKILPEAGIEFKPVPLGEPIEY